MRKHFGGGQAFMGWFMKSINKYIKHTVMYYSFIIMVC